ncbi:unnamed protein product [Vitrella brassicaformis CCMP3155]|uniref:Uncharacterized protein n=1 Tax=Vitrella brassicaformis (strain CCMP3155) TaxID=1169540 RepID=A0A0G4EPL4_VITBC|nr:unnamed protein product [Vitrella brassicaformis CCMP3155]|eukprot:CEL99407.1 unnamed protein product [Vitrella brassicaformis CCMP3155]
MGAVNSKSTDEASPAINGQVLDVVYRDERDELHNVKDLGHIRRSALFFSKVDFPAEILRNRLDRSLHRIRLADGTRLAAVLTFDAQTVSEPRELLAAVWLVEEQKWDEVAEVLQWASECGFCQLPVKLTADDINTHASKTAYGSVARVLAQLMVVGRHIDFRDGSCLQLFRHANDEVRAIKDQPGFEVTVDPPLPAGHLYQQHRQQHDPPVRSDIFYHMGINQWVSGGVPSAFASVSSFAKEMVLNHFEITHQTNPTGILLNGRVGGGRLDGLLTQSPHTPVAGCTTTFSREDGIGEVRVLVLTNSSHNFVAWIAIFDWGDGIVRVDVHTTEAPVAGAGGAFKDRLPLTTRLARVALGRVAPYVFDGLVDDDNDDDDDDSDGHGGGWDDMDDDSDGEDSGGEDASAAQNGANDGNTSR